MPSEALSVSLGLQNFAQERDHQSDCRLNCRAIVVGAKRHRGKPIIIFESGAGAPSKGLFRRVVGNAVQPGLEFRRPPQQQRPLGRAPRVFRVRRGAPRSSSFVVAVVRWLFFVLRGGRRCHHRRFSAAWRRGPSSAASPDDQQLSLL